MVHIEWGYLSLFIMPATEDGWLVVTLFRFAKLKRHLIHWVENEKVELPTYMTYESPELASVPYFFVFLQNRNQLHC